MGNYYPLTFQTAAVATGNGTANAVYGQAAVGVQVQGITSATVTWEGTVDGTHWTSLNALNRATLAVATTATADGLYLLDVAGVHDVRARLSTYSSGTITITGIVVPQAAIPWALTATFGASELHLGAVGGATVVAAGNTITRPADTTAYAVGDLVANSTTAGSVTPCTFTVARVAAGSCLIRRARLRKSTTSTTNAQFRLHLYTSAPTCANGDNGAWSTDGVANYLGAFDITVDKAFTDGASGNGVPLTGSEVNVALASGTTIVGLLEARAAYAPGNAETLTPALEVLQN